jgi:HAT1-interacting factor 1
VQDYTAALDIKKALLPASSRALASAHYQLGTVLEFTPAGRKAALEHVQAALDGFKLRAADITAADAGKADEVKSEDVARMTSKEREAESRDVAALIGDLEVKIEELNSAPEPADFVAESINHLLGGAPAAGSSAAAVDSRPVNDLTSMVRKKAPKKPTAAAPPAAANGAEKRKADDEAGPADKKAKAD